MTTFDRIHVNFREALPKVDFCSLRFSETMDEHLRCRRGIIEPPSLSEDRGYMVTVTHGDGAGYAASSDFSVQGMRRAFATAQIWAEESARQPLISFSKLRHPKKSGFYRSAIQSGWDTVAPQEKLALLKQQAEKLAIDPRIVDWETAFWHQTQNKLILTSDGTRIEQSFEYNFPTISATAHDKGETEIRTASGHAYCLQGGYESILSFLTSELTHKTATEALQLLSAPNCPTGAMDLLLRPDQMYIQIHESIGHPLELDRILGDERNYAGTSFVTKDMFGEYRYGSNLLNVVFDPQHEGELASYAFDDEGTVAEKCYLIEGGILKRGLGGTTSQMRSGIAGGASTRACNWNRPAIDRMGNINIEPGESSMQDMVSAIENGVMMETNQSWSIDDSRNKFQFGCEIGWVIRNGEKKEMVRKPNYRGISANFWRNLKMVGSAATTEVLGTPYCGKGEPGQSIFVGHASPACLFADTQVFGGE